MYVRIYKNKESKAKTKANTTVYTYEFFFLLLTIGDRFGGERKMKSATQQEHNIVTTATEIYTTMENVPSGAKASFTTSQTWIRSRKCPMVV